MAPESGSIRLGVNLQMAVFDQNRTALDPSRSLWESLTGDRVLGVKGNSDQVMVRGRPRDDLLGCSGFVHLGRREGPTNLAFSIPNIAWPS